MGIDYENDLLKHFVRTDGWLPVCKKRLQRIRKKLKRRLRYFTFCAVNAVDVLMLDVAKVVSRSPSDRFDTVYFFDKDEASVVETRKRIPGAVGFPGNFIEVVLVDESEDALVEAASPLDAPEDQQDEAVVHQSQQIRDQKLNFIRSFPFDVVNLDLEQFLFKPKEEFPGKLLRAMRKMFHWQRRPLMHEGRNRGSIDGFSLMFTTRIGPPDIAAPIITMLEDYLRANLRNDAELLHLIDGRAGTTDVATLRGQQFDLFFKLAIPKAIAGILLENDWFIEPSAGIAMYQFERPSVNGPYQMLHLVMDVERQNPPVEKRAPAHGHGPSWTSEAQTAYRDVTRKLFREPEKMVKEAELDVNKLMASLALIKARRKKYCPDYD